MPSRPFATALPDASSRSAMRALCLSALLLVLAAPSWAQSRTETAFDLLRLDTSARTASLAGTGALAGDDPAALFANPALLAPQAHGGLALSYTNLALDVNAGAAVYARETSRLGGLVIGGGVRYLSYGDFERRSDADADADPEGTFGASEAAVTLAVSHGLLPRVRVGVAGHALFASIDEAGAQALAADVGLSYAHEEQGLVLGASVHHLGGVLSSLGDETDRLPLDVRITASKRLRYVPLTVSVAGIDLQRFEGQASDSSFVGRALDHVALGGELQLGTAFSVRGGYNGRRGSDLRSGGRLDLAGVSVGAGIQLRRVSVDYAFSNWGSFGGLHQFGLRTRL